MPRLRLRDAGWNVPCITQTFKRPFSTVPRLFGKIWFCVIFATKTVNSKIDSGSNNWPICTQKSTKRSFKSSKNNQKIRMKYFELGDLSSIANYLHYACFFCLQHDTLVWIKEKSRVPSNFFRHFKLLFCSSWTVVYHETGIKWKLKT